MKKLENQYLSINRNLSHNLSICCLVVALFSGAFSLDGLLPILPAALSWLLEPRWSLTIASIGLGVASGCLRRPAPAIVSLCLAWGLFAIYLVGRSLAYRSELVWNDVESILLISLMLLAAAMLLDCPKRAISFLWASIVTIAAAAIGTVAVSLFDGSPDPVMPFYASRTFMVGAFVCVFLALLQRKRSSAALLAAVGAFLVYAGLASIMRASTLMSLVAVATILPLLFARSQWRAAGMLGGVLCLGLVSYFVVHGQAFQKKMSDYDPVRASAAAPTSAPAEAVDLCASRIAGLSGHELAGAELARSCDGRIVLTDTDARLRMLLHAWADNPSKLFGAGLGSYEFYEASRPAKPVGHYAYPHNLFAEVFYSGGAVGLFLLGAALLAVLSISIWSVLSSDQPTAVLTCVVVFTGLVSLVGGDLYDSRLLWIFPVILAAVASGRNGSARSAR